MPTEPPEKYLSILEFAEAMGVNISTVTRWLANGHPTHGKLRHRRPTRAVEIAASEVDRLHSEIPLEPSASVSLAKQMANGDYEEVLGRQLQRSQKANANKLRYQVATKLVIDYFAAAFKKNKAWNPNDPKKKSRVMDRLVENRCNISQLLFAIDGSKGDKWLMGTAENSVRAYKDIKTILRDSEQVERLTELAGWDGEQLHPLYVELGGE